MTKTIVANWKMLPDTIEQAEALMQRVAEYVRTLEAQTMDIVVCPQESYLERIGKLIGESGIALGAQDVGVSSRELADADVRFVLIGHSDRRWKAGDSDEITNAKLKEALRAGLTPIVCFGERTRDQGWEAALAAQTVATLAGFTEGQIAQCRIAYEPVWAISTNPDAKPDTPASAVQSMNHIRETIADHFDVSQTTYLYGGSVTPDNVASFLERSEVSGVLVGGASVRSDDFCRILTIASTIV